MKQTTVNRKNNMAIIKSERPRKEYDYSRIIKLLDAGLSNFQIKQRIGCGDGVIERAKKKRAEQCEK